MRSPYLAYEKYAVAQARQIFPSFVTNAIYRSQSEAHMQLLALLGIY